MQPENLKPAPASIMQAMSQPMQYSPAMQQLLENNRRALLCGPLLSKPEEISGYLVDTKDGPGLRVNLQNHELDKKYKNPRPPVSVLATLAEWQAEFKLTPRLLLKLTPLLQQVALALLVAPE
jgi:hypothetical protein